jgi:multidrug resistance efflux pump
MIKGISSQGSFITVSGGSPSTTYISPGSVGAGMMRYNGNMNCVEINDGNMWKAMDMSYATISLTGEAEVILQWAKQKRIEELEMTALAETHPAVKIALENLNKAEQQLKATVILSKEYDETTN